MSHVIQKDAGAEAGEAFFHAAQAALGVQDRFQFFVWMHLHLQRFIPHDLVLFRIPPAPEADATARAFHCVPVGTNVLELLAQAQSPFWCALIERWHRGGRKPVVILLDASLPFAEAAGLKAGGFDTLFVHGVEGWRRSKDETMFAFGRRVAVDRGAGPAANALVAALVCQNLALWLPYLYFTSLRAFATLDIASPVTTAPGSPPAARTRGGTDADRSALLTARELQVLEAVRGARRNSEIGVALGISPLTVKNHLRKIMQKLGARNRAHAVAEAMSRRLIA